MSLRETATRIVRRLQEAGHSAFFVGGCVRDALLGKQPQDYDIATSARPEAVESLFPKTVPVGRQFGVILVIEDGQPFQVATFRADVGYVDGRRPTAVTFTDAREDALRRDFTVNGLFFDPVSETLHDWVNGAADLRARVIRTIGDPQLRFAEDYLRLLRAVRFAAQLDFTIEAATFAAVREHAAKISGISAERVRDELVKLFRPPHAARGLRLLHESGLLGHVLPELAATVGCQQSPDYHPEGDVFTHIGLMLQQLPADASIELAWAVLLHDIAKPPTASRNEQTGAIHFYGHEKVGAEMSEAILRRLRFTNHQIAAIVDAVLHHMQFKDVPKMRKATLRRMILRDTFPLELELHRLDCLGSHQRLDHYDFLVRNADELAHQPELIPPLLDGRDVLASGIPAGPQVGALLNELRDLQLDGTLTSAEAAREWLRGRARELALQGAVEGPSA